LAVDTPAELARRVEAVSAIVVRVLGPADAVAATLGALPGVSDVERLRLPEPGVTEIRLRASDPVQAPGAIAGAILACGWTLLEVRREVPSLEDLFVRLVA
jgi:hypothetical protein